MAGCSGPCGRNSGPTRLLAYYQAANAHDELIEFARGTVFRTRNPSTVVSTRRMAACSRPFGRNSGATRLLAYCEAAKAHDELIEFASGTGLRPRTPSIVVKIRIRISLSVTLTSSGYGRMRSHHQPPG